MNCPNKSDENWIVLEKKLGSLGAHAVYDSMGLPDVINHPTYTGTKASLVEALSENFLRACLATLIMNLIFRRL